MIDIETEIIPWVQRQLSRLRYHFHPFCTVDFLLWRSSYLCSVHNASSHAGIILTKKYL